MHLDEVLCAWVPLRNLWMKKAGIDDEQNAGHHVVSAVAPVCHDVCHTLQVTKYFHVSWPVGSS